MGRVGLIWIIWLLWVRNFFFDLEFLRIIYVLDIVLSSGKIEIKEVVFVFI